MPRLIPTAVLMFIVFLFASGVSQFAHAESRTMDDQFEVGSVEIEHTGGTRNYPYRLHRPTSLVPNANLPLIVFLHGAGERGADNVAQLKHFPKRFVTEPHLTKHSAYVLAVQCPSRETWITAVGKNWDLPTRFEVITPSMKAVIAAIQTVVHEEPIDRTRIYLTGLSMGGFGAWDLAARHPDWFAAVMPICGGGSPVQMAERLVGVPIWAFHGIGDRIVTQRQSIAMIDAIRAAGGTPAYTAIPNVGHASWNVAYGPQGGMTWLFSNKREEPADIPPTKDVEDSEEDS